MGLHRFKPVPSGRMGVLWTLSTIRNAAIIEFGCMGHMLYTGVTLKRAGVYNACKLYSTHINETDIALGDTSRLEKVIADVIERECVRVIFLTPSSIPEVIGIDIPAICEGLQSQYPDICFVPFGCGGFDRTQHQGVQEALTLLVKTLPKDMGRTQLPTFNLIGSCADLFRFQADAEEIIRIMKGAFNMDPVCILSSDASVEEIERMGGAHINLIVRREGKEAGREMKKRFGTPYLLGRPYGVEGTINWLMKIAQLLDMEINSEFLIDEKEATLGRVAEVMPNFRRIVRSFPESATLSLGGHADVVKGILSYGCDELSFTKGICWCDCPDMGDEDIPYLTEDDWSKAVINHTKGWLMASGEALEWSGKNTNMQISNPDTKWRIYPYAPPFVGFRGAVHLANLWINSNDPD